MVRGPDTAMADDLSKIRQAPDPVSARSPVAESPDTTQEESGKTDQLLLKTKRQYQAACRGENRLRKDMLDDRRFRRRAARCAAITHTRIPTPARAHDRARDPVDGAWACDRSRWTGRPSLVSRFCGLFGTAPRADSSPPLSSGSPPVRRCYQRIVARASPT